jgi:hypothetical protein
MLALALFATFSLQACSPQEDRMAQVAEPGSPSPGVAPDAAMEHQRIRLTGCVERGTGIGEYLLTGVATAGIVDPPEEEQTDKRSWTAEPQTTPEAAARLKAASTYRLVASEENLADYVGNRVTVGGRLAVEAPEATAGDTPEGGELVESTPDSATIVAEAPQSRGFYVDSISKVSDTCSR